VPLTASGNLAIVTSSDLGGLGPREGLPVTYNWMLPSLAPLLLPWLVILGLLALKPNRCAAAWWIWLPIGCLVALTQAALAILSPGANFFTDIIAALAVGLAAVWLLSNYLRRPHRFMTFLCLLPALAGFSVLAFVSQQSGSFTIEETLQADIVLAVGVLVSSAALSLGGLICRGRYRPFRLYVWLLLLLAVMWLVIVAPFFVLQMGVSGGRIGWSVFFVVILAVAAFHFATLLPFLILSSASPFYRERLKALLHVKPETPPVLAPLPEASLKV
jgi:multisubunit Na+/H+ antiporter MnhE subunit